MRPELPTAPWDAIEDLSGCPQVIYDPDGTRVAMLHMTEQQIHEELIGTVGSTTADEDMGTSIHEAMRQARGFDQAFTEILYATQWPRHPHRPYSPGREHLPYSEPGVSAVDAEATRRRAAAEATDFWIRWNP